MEPDDTLSPTPPPRSPFGDPPQSPRLGIIHLMVGTALVACVLSVVRLSAMPWSMEIPAWNLGLWSMSGLALGGPLLFVVRRSRGMRFPVHPGETLWILQGIESLYHIAFRAAIGLYLIGGLGVFRHVWHHTFLIESVLFGTIYLVAARRTTIRRWRVFFYAHAAHYAAYLVFICAGFTLARYWTLLFPGGVLAAVVLTDVLRRGRYPWSHWSGVAIYFWSCGGSICCMVYYTFFLRLNL